MMKPTVDLRAELLMLEKLRGRFHEVFPSYISHIRFPRYKNMAVDARIDFDFPITALVGVNGSGKTSVLNALYGAPNRYSTGEYWFSTEVDPIEEGDGSPNRFIYGHYKAAIKQIVETRKARVRKTRNGRPDPNYWEPTKEAPGDGMRPPVPLTSDKKIEGRSLDRWNPVNRKVLYINFRKELSAFDKYFYFGKDPAIEASRKAAAAKTAGKNPPTGRINSKMDRVRHDAVILARVIATGDTSLTSRSQKIATENRLLTAEELKTVTFVLGRDYVEARWIQHRLFQGDGGLSVVFKTKHGRYSEAFAGSGEVAVTSCIVQIINAAKGTLLLLDEPEVSLHPGAQERLLAFLALMAKRNQLQVVLSTHSPHLIAALPDDAIKTFYQMPDGAFGIIPSSHPYAAFRRLGDTRGGEVQVIVEDRLAKAVVEQAISLMTDEAARELFTVEFVQGGASSILNARIPVLMEGKGNVLVLLDGDQRKAREIPNPDEIPMSRDNTLGTVIFDNVGAKPVPLIDGGTGGGDKAQKAGFFRRYLNWVRHNLSFIPTSCPEELVLRAAGPVVDTDVRTSQVYKQQLHQAASVNLGRDAINEDTDAFGQVLLGMNRAQSQELIELKDILETFLKGIKAS
jgi:ABC-type cobalamin/Fe3+-siderophores transport system ATPase subunit